MVLELAKDHGMYISWMLKSTFLRKSIDCTSLRITIPNIVKLVSNCRTITIQPLMLPGPVAAWCCHRGLWRDVRKPRTRVLGDFLQIVG